MGRDRVAVVGAGNGGYAAAADLSLAGYEVALYEFPEFSDNIEPVRQAGAIRIVGGMREGVAEIAVATTDIGRALAGARMVLVVLPSYGIGPAAEVMAPHLGPEQQVILAPGGTGGALEFARVLRDRGVKPPPVGETATLPWAARRIPWKAEVHVYLNVKTLFFACFPAARGERVHREFGVAYPAAALVSDVMESALNNGNPITHPAPMLLNAARLEAGEDYLFYGQGITPAVARVNARLDGERLAVCRRLGYEEIPAHRRLFLMGYAPERDTLYEAYRDSEAFAPIRAPESLEDRYITEDVPYGLVPLASIAAQFSVPTPLMDAVILMHETLMDRDFRAQGRTAEGLGIAGLTPRQLRDFLQEGY